MVEIKKAACHFCHMNCGMLVELDGGKAVKVTGDPDHPFNIGAQCPRGASALDHLDHPNRVNYPLKLDGPRGSGKYKRVTWDEALKDIAARLNDVKKQYGAEAICSFGGTNRTDDFARRRFFNILGSPNVAHTAPVCWIPNFLTETALYGWAAFDPEVSMGPRCVVVWGHNPACSYLPEMRGLLESRKKFGTRIIVVDPNFSETASKADIWLPIKPGTDNALALAWLNVIINEGMFDFDFVEDWTVGFEELMERVEEYTPEWASEKTGVPAELITQSAILYASSKPACIQWGVATDQLGKGSYAGAHARACLRMITGNLDKQGGDVMPGPHPTFITDWEMELNELLSEEQRAKQIGSDKFKLHTWPGYKMLCESQLKVWGKCIPAEWFCEANPPMLFRTMITADPYPVKATIILANNPLVSYSNSRQTYDALMNQDLIVAVEYWMTPSAVLADYILPAASWMERPVMTTIYGVSDWLVASERAVAPLYERKTDYDFWRELGLEMGQAEYWPWETDEDMFTYRMSKLGTEVETYDDFVHVYRMHFADRNYHKYLERGFATPSGKAELKSSVFEALGLEPLPHWVEPVTGLETSGASEKDYPYILNAGSGFMPFFHSEHRELTRLRILKPYPYCTINPRLAKKLGIKHGDWVCIETPTGKAKQKANLSESVAYEVIQAERGWWYPEMDVAAPTLMGVFESNINVALNDDPEICDEACGSWPIRRLNCNIKKAEKGVE